MQEFIFTLAGFGLLLALVVWFCLDITRRHELGWNRIRAVAQLVFTCIFGIIFIWMLISGTLSSDTIFLAAIWVFFPFIFCFDWSALRRNEKNETEDVLELDLENE